MKRIRLLLMGAAFVAMTVVHVSCSTDEISTITEGDGNVVFNAELADSP